MKNRAKKRWFALIILLLCAVVIGLFYWNGQKKMQNDEGYLVKYSLLFTPVSITPLIDTEDARFDLNASRPIAKGDLKWRDALLVAHRVNSNKNIFKKQSALLIFLIDGIIIALIRNHTVFRRIKEWRIYYNGEKKH